MSFSPKNLLRRLLQRGGFSLHRVDSDPVLAELRSAHDRLRLQPGNPAAWQPTLARLGLHALLRDLLAVHAPDLVLDIGANHGQFGRTIRALGYQGRIISLEPQSRLAAELGRTADPAWQVLCGAAGDREHEMELQVFQDDTFSSLHSLLPVAGANFGNMVQPTKREWVRVRPLDAWLSELDIGPAARVLLKTDTQGHDLAVLRGATRTLHRVRIVLAEAALIPIYTEAADLATLMAHLAASELVPSGFFPVSQRNTDLAAIELDCVFTRAAPSR